MGLLVLSERDVFELLPVADCIDVMQAAFATAARGGFMQPLRSIAWLPDRRGAIGTMPAYIAEPDAAGAKVITVFPQNRALGIDSHQGAVMLHETQTGRLLAIVHAGAVTAVRTAAVSGLATRMLANPDAHDLAILGSGTQADMHLKAMRAVRPIRAVKVWSRTFAHAREFVQRHAGGDDIAIEAVASAREAIAGAHIVCTVTAATAPILQGAWLEPGMHVNAVGSSVPPFRELDAQAVRRSRLFVDNRECVLAEADDLRVPIADGEIAATHILGDLGELATAGVPGRIGSEDITLFKSVGMAIEDVAAARELYTRAKRRGRGTEVEY